MNNHLEEFRMFKGLKSKLEDQGKKLQASVAQYGEQLSEQIGSIRSAAVSLWFTLLFLRESTLFNFP